MARRGTLRRLEDVLGARDTARDAITFTAPPEVANVFLLALEAARLHLEAENQARQSATDALLWVLDHVIAAWAKQGAQFRDYAGSARYTICAASMPAACAAADVRRRG